MKFNFGVHCKIINTQEKIYAWKPLENLHGKFYIHFVCRDSQGFRIILVKKNDLKKGILLDFYGSVRSYRESDDLLSMHSLEGPVIPYEGYVQPEKPEDSSWAFFKIENSEYLKWASYQSDGVSEHLRLVHYVIWTEDATVDILSWAEPEVTWIDIDA